MNTFNIEAMLDFFFSGGGRGGGDINCCTLQVLVIKDKITQQIIGPLTSAATMKMTQID